MKDLKASLRKQALERRRSYVASLTSGTIERISMRVVERIQEYFQFPKEFVISTYFPRDDEFNARLLNLVLHDEGHIMAYPRVEPDGSISFREVASTKDLAPGSFGLMEPSATATVVHPNLLFVPLLAFDKRCHRLGYGKGHYDRALQAARADRNILAIGLAYDMQRIDEIPNEPLDEQLEYVVTEAQIYKAEKK